MSINPNSEQYINDLLKSNREDFGAINHFYKEIKALRFKRRTLESLGDINEANLFQIADITTKILIYYKSIQHCRKCINGRLEEINHVKEVARHGA